MIAGKTLLLPFNGSDVFGGIDLKADGSNCRRKSSLKLLGLPCAPNLDRRFCIVATAKNAPKKPLDSVNEISFSQSYALTL